MLRSLLIDEDMTMVLPWRKLGIATLIVAVAMNKISCAVERKTAGRALGEGSSSGALLTSSGRFFISTSPAAPPAASRLTEAMTVVRRDAS